MTKKIECSVTIEEDLLIGEQANAFRIIDDSEGVYMLDFVIYSHHENVAKVIARIRCDEIFLGTVMDTISQKLEDISNLDKDSKMVRVISLNDEEIN